MTIEFKLNTSNKESKKGFALIIYVYLNKIQKISTPYHCKMSDWDDLLKEPKRSHPFYFDLLDYVLKTKIKINTILGKPNNYISIKQIESFLANENPDSFINFLKNYCEVFGKIIGIRIQIHAIRLEYKNRIKFFYIQSIKDFLMILRNSCCQVYTHYKVATIQPYQGRLLLFNSISQSNILFLKIKHKAHY